MNLRYSLYKQFYKQRAYLAAFWCLVRGHKVEWHAYRDEICWGDIICNTCDIVHWCRGWE